MSRNKLSIRKITSTQEVILLLEKDLQDLKATIKVTSRLKGSEKATALARIDRRTINNIDNLLMSLETSILTEEEDHDYHTIQELKQEYQHFEATFDQLKKELEFTRN